jgi:hypothetical protein
VVRRRDAVRQQLPVTIHQSHIERKENSAPRHPLAFKSVPVQIHHTGQEQAVFEVQGAGRTGDSEFQNPSTLDGDAPRP